MKTLADISKFESLCVNNGIGKTFTAEDYEYFTPYSFPTSYEISVREKYPDYERDDHWRDVYDRANGLWIDDEHSNEVLSDLKHKINGKNKRERRRATRDYYDLLEDKDRLRNEFIIDPDFQVPVPYIDMMRSITPDQIDWHETGGFDAVKEILDRFAKKDTFDFGTLTDNDRKALSDYFFGSYGNSDGFLGDDRIREYLKENFPDKAHERAGISWSVYRDDGDTIVDRLGKRGTSWTVDDLVNRIRRELKKEKE